MFDVFDQPWTLLAAAVVVWLVILTLRSIFPQKRRFRQLAIPALIAAAALGLDLLVQTDLEKIKSVIKVGLEAAEEENPDAIEAIISDNYSDSYHNTKEELMYYCRALLSEPLIDKNRKMNSIIELSPPTATVTLLVLTKFDPNNEISQYKPYLFTKAKIYLQKEQLKIETYPEHSRRNRKSKMTRWLINRAEVLELDKQPVNWKDIK